jgi:hypothetical protein
MLNLSYIYVDNKNTLTPNFNCRFLWHYFECLIIFRLLDSMTNESRVGDAQNVEACKTMRSAK